MRVQSTSIHHSTHCMFFVHTRSAYALHCSCRRPGIQQLLNTPLLFHWQETLAGHSQQLHVRACMSLCVSGRGLASVCSTNDEVCTMYTLAHNDRLPPVFHYKHRMFRGFLVYMADPLSACSTRSIPVVHMHADRQTHLWPAVDTHTSGCML